MIWVNGVLNDTLPITDRGLLYGDGVWETIAIVNGQPQRLSWHLERLLQGLQALAIPAPDMTQWVTEILQACQGRDSAVLKLIVTRGQGMRGYNPRECQQPTRIAQISARYVYPAAYAQQGIRLALCETRLAQQPRLAGFKHLNRLEQVLLKQEADQQGWLEALVSDVQGYIVEGVSSNCFIRINGRWITPELRYNGVHGVMRATILSRMQQSQIECEQRYIGIDELGQIQSLFFCNALHPMKAVVRFHDRALEQQPCLDLFKTLKLNQID